jgi:hypothetical protein
MEAKAVAAIRAGEKELSDYAYASGSEWVTICLALGLYDEIGGVGNCLRAWAGLDNGQRRLVQSENPDFRVSAFGMSDEPDLPESLKAARRRYMAMKWRTRDGATT